MDRQRVAGLGRVARAAGAAYDPDAHPKTDAWRELAPPPAEVLRGVSLVAVDDRLVALGGLTYPGGPMGAWMLDSAGQGHADHRPDLPLANRGLLAS